MSEIEKIKIEARQLLEEVNNPFGLSNGTRFGTRIRDFEYTGQSTFRERLADLKQKASLLKLASASFAYRF